MNDKLLHIIYTIQIFLTAMQKYDNFVIKFLIFLLLSLFSFLLHINDLQLFKIKDLLVRLTNKYNDLLNDYMEILNERNELTNQLINYEIPIHIKLQYINYLIHKEYNCPICLITITKNEKVTLTSCGHLFHNNCINHDFNNSDKCPTCRAYIGYDLEYEEEISTDFPVIIS